LYVDRWGETDAGRQRPDNQDTIYFAQAGKQGITQAQIDAHGVLLAVADGVGGELGGQEASQTIIRHFVAAYYNAPTVDPVNNLRQAIQQADRLARQEVTQREAATTLVAVVIWQNRLFVANIGDSRAYWIRGQQIHQLTEDHVQDGKLARYLVSYPNVQADMVQLPDLAVGDRVLLCSDGLYDPVPEAQAIRALAARGGAKGAAKRLVKTANRYGGPDNVSVVMAHIAKRPPVVMWEIGLIVALLLLIVILVGLITNTFLPGSGNSNTPSLLPTTAVPAVLDIETPTLTVTPILTMATETTEVLPGQPTSTLQPTRTPTATPSDTPTPTHTSTPLPTFAPLPTSTLTVVATETAVPPTTPPQSTATPVPQATNTPIPVSPSPEPATFTPEPEI
jgi:PPM family protein phosphatase